ncbi:hypothetical protein [Azospirillum soli]|uniref:hypothetical protein n=1 Tax=Azospirillum soli TaxID=1304799 RepID=UPI001AE46F44|nr:hypothetical protein [Azospirillum soli]MBP2315694.1 hypothetical protein [Azospirillum soli]
MLKNAVTKLKGEDGAARPDDSKLDALGLPDPALPRHRQPMTARGMPISRKIA